MNEAAIVIFRYKTGYTQKYAEWIAEELSCGLVPLNGMTAEALEPYQMIIYGGGLRAGQISGLKKLKKLLSAKGNRKLIFFCTGLTDGTPEYLSEIKKVNFTPAEQETAELFYFPGGFDYRKLNGPEKLLMKLMKKTLSKEKDGSQSPFADLGKETNLTNRGLLEPLLQKLR